jgi:general secretion pathway protein J
MKTTRLPRRAAARGMTMIEVMVALAILAMIGLLIYGAFDSLSKGKKSEGMRAERARQGRDAILRITREMSGAFISLHNPQSQALITRATGFIAQNNGTFDRVDFTSFAHKRVERDAKESDQAEVGYFVVPDPDVRDKMDLVRREQTPIDADIKRGGVVNVLAENVEEFDLRYVDPTTGIWQETWDSTQQTAQLARLPFEVRIRLVLKETARPDQAPAGRTPVPYEFTTKFFLPIQQPLSFAIPR